MNELIKVNYENDNPTVSGRDLHEFLEVKSKYADWFKNMCSYGFNEKTDFLTFSNNLENGGRTIDHQLTIEMAKEICMLQRNERGKQARQYFINLEKAWNTPEMIMSRALKVAENQLKALKAENTRLAVDNQLMQPKAVYFDTLCERGLLTNFRETAKQLEIKEKHFIKFLLDKKYIYRDKRGKLLPYSDKADLFEIKESINDKTGWSGTQTLVTPKGREIFMNLHLEAL